MPVVFRLTAQVSVKYCRQLWMPSRLKVTVARRLYRRYWLSSSILVLSPW